MKHAQKGFTLIEIMIVVAIIAILAAVAIPNFIAYRRTSQMNACKSNMESILNANEAYAVAKGAYPSDLSALAKSDGTGFLKTIPTCPAGGDYTLTQGSDGKPATVECGSTDTGADTPHNAATGS